MGLWLSLLVPFLVGGSLYYSMHQSTQRSAPSARLLPNGSRGASSIPFLSVAEDPATSAGSERSAPSEKRQHGGSDAPKRSKIPVGDSSLRNELCHVSGLQMSAVVEANQKSAATCFDRDLASYPKNVGLSSDWQVELDGLGQVYAAQGRLHLLDYQRSPQEREAQKISLPGSTALRCAEAAIRKWSFPKYSPKDGARMRMRCSFNLTIKDL